MEDLATGLNGPWALAIVTLTKNIADFNSDYEVNFQDYAVLVSAWLTVPPHTQWNPACDISMPADYRIDMLDLRIFAENWLFQDGQQ